MTGGNVNVYPFNHENNMADIIYNDSIRQLHAPLQPYSVCTNLL